MDEGQWQTSMQFGSVHIKSGLRINFLACSKNYNLLVRDMILTQEEALELLLLSTSQELMPLKEISFPEPYHTGICCLQKQYQLIIIAVLQLLLISQ